MPAERAELHADVDPGHVDTAHVLQARELKQRVLLVLEIAEVPCVVLIIFLSIAEILLLLRAKATAV